MDLHTMDNEKTDCGELSDVVLHENTDTELQSQSKRKKRPKRVLQFSDGFLEEYSSDDEVDTPRESKNIPHVDPKTMTWLPWAWYQTVAASSKMLEGCDYVGEWLADFFGITAPKYQFEIDEFLRVQELEKEMARKNNMEMAGWNEKNKANLLSNNNNIPRAESV